MWIFGQVWFACLVGFAVGVLLDWAIRVRPLTKRVAELEDRIAAGARAARAEGELGRSVFDRGPFAPANMDPDGFVTQRNRGGLLTPAREPENSLATDLISMGPDQTEARTGVEDYPGVSRLSTTWEAEAEEATRNAPEPWHPVSAEPERASEAWQPEAERTVESWHQKPFEPEGEPEPEEWTPITITSSAPPVDESASWRTELNPPVEPPPPTDAEADRQYLEFLRAGAAHAPADPSADGDDGYDDNADFPADMHGEVPEDVPGAAEVTTVLPFPLAEQSETDEEAPRLEGYEAYENYADEYQRNGNGEAGQSQDYQYGEYQYYTEDVEEPEESATPLPRRGAAGESSLRFAPFEALYEPQSDAEPVGVTPRPGELTPISEGGWHPFQKPAEVDAGDGYESYEPFQPAGADASLNGAHALRGQDDGGQDDGQGPSSWFDLAGGQPAERQPAETTTMTHRMLPVSRPDMDHPDLLGQSVFGGNDAPSYAEDPAPRSLFEPVIAPDTLEDDFGAPGYQQPEPPVQPAAESSSDDFFAPRPIRVRTGLDGPPTQIIPAIRPEPEHVAAPPEGGAAGQPAPGPFGPGSALPLPDGSAPTPDFRIKARTSSMVFHTEASPFYERLEPQVWFRNQEDAKRAGFTSWERPRSW
jgi:hypothetical protein